MTSTPIQHDWLYIGQSVFLFVIGLISSWNAYRANRTAKTVDDVHDLVNSQSGMTKKALAEVTAAKALLTEGKQGHSLDVSAAEAAMADYLDHVKKQAKVDSKLETTETKTIIL
jgi:hypothetical protein